MQIGKNKIKIEKIEKYRKKKNRN